MEELECIKLFSCTDELNGLASDVLDRQGSTASCITVHLREHDARDVEKVVERLCNVYGILTEHCVHYEKNLGRCGCFFNFYKLCHELFINVKTSGSINEHHIVSVFLCVFNARLGNLNGGDLSAHRENGDVSSFTYDFELIDSCGSVDVAGNEQGRLALMLIIGSDLCGMRCFTRTLKTYHHNYSRRLRADIDLRCLTAHKLY